MSVQKTQISVCKTEPLNGWFMFQKEKHLNIWSNRNTFLLHTVCVRNHCFCNRFTQFTKSFRINSTYECAAIPFDPVRWHLMKNVDPKSRTQLQNKIMQIKVCVLITGWWKRAIEFFLFYWNFYEQSTKLQIIFDFEFFCSKKKKHAKTFWNLLFKNLSTTYARWKCFESYIVHFIITLFLP